MPNNGGLEQVDRIQGRGEMPVAMVAENGDQEESECYVKIYFDGVKGVALEVRRAWQRRRRN